MLQRLFGLQPSSRQSVQKITSPELHERLQNGEAIILVDVRQPEEYNYEGHIRGARLLPLSVLLQRSQELPKDRPIVCVCRSGSRSHTACEQLAGQGFTDVANLVGGMMGWRRAGLLIQKK